MSIVMCTSTGDVVDGILTGWRFAWLDPAHMQVSVTVVLHMYERMRIHANGDVSINRPNEITMQFESMEQAQCWMVDQFPNALELIKSKTILIRKAQQLHQLKWEL